MLDFPLNTAIRNVFGSNANFSDIDSVISQEGSNFTWKEDLVTFIDNHDMARFLSINNNNNRLHEALAFTLTSRGIRASTTAPNNTCTTIRVAAPILTTAR